MAGDTVAAVCSLSFIDRWGWVSNDGTIISGGHVRSDKLDDLFSIFENERIEVQPDTWFNFFKKDRWFDLVCEGTNPKPPDNTHWSVDNKALWDVLSISIELANRMLHAFMDDKHEMLETLLWGRLTKWKNLENVLKNLVWSFKAEGNDTTTYAETRVPRQQQGQLIMLSAELIHPLLTADDATLAERVLIQVHFACVMIHEMSHAMICSRIYDRQDPGNELWGTKQPVNKMWPIQSAPDWIGNYKEPHIDFDEFSEIGRAVEKSLFYAPIRWRPGGASLPITYFKSWIGGVHNFAQSDNPDEANTLARVPPIQLAKLLSEQFWSTRTRPERSNNYFYSVDIFRGHLLGATVVNEDNRARWGPGDQEAVDFWRERKDELLLHRGNWDKQEQSRWEATPWSKYRLRAKIESFHQAFAEGDELTAYRCCMTLLVPSGEQVGWQDGTKFNDYLSRVTDTSHEWYFFIVGLLMAAAMPICGQRRFIEAKSKDWKCTMNPSQTASQRYTAPIVIDRQGIHTGAWREISEFWNPLKGHDPIQVNLNPTPLDYIELAESILKELCQRQATVFGSWYDELDRVVKLMREDRHGRFSKYGQNGKSNWASTWHFLIPLYNRQNLRLKRYDNIRKGWVEV
ncbi:hypothetical protein F5Y18DRAFT_425764 [Xylariaceae sp. FL1019]|nr:hypothetical protein F5Y18DRAFT_425764 [Xylariaceae sp. FL1019]